MMIDPCVEKPTDEPAAAVAMVVTEVAPAAAVAEATTDFTAGTIIVE